MDRLTDGGRRIRGMLRGKSITVTPYKRSIKSVPKVPRLCPTCITPMVLTDVWRCPKHGEPTRP